MRSAHCDHAGEGPVGAANDERVLRPEIDGDSLDYVDAYPFAEQGTHGMWTFTPLGQRWGGTWRVPTGWWVVSGDAERILEAHGVPDGEVPRPTASHLLRA